MRTRAPGAMRARLAVIALSELAGLARLGGLAAILSATLFLGCRHSPPQRPHILMVVVDTLRADHLGVYGSDRDLTPNLDALASQSTLFRRAYSPASYTLPSVVGLLTGRFPESVGIRANISIFQGLAPTLAVLLYSSGWRTAAVISNPVLQRRVGLHNGFDEYNDVRAYRPAGETTDAALRTLQTHVETSQAPLFLWVHYQDPHGPYRPPEGYRERYLEAERARPDGRRILPSDASHIGHAAIPNYQFVEGQREVAFYRAGYAGEIRFVDEQIGRLLAELARLGIDDETIIVFTADHGEALGEDDYWFAHGETLNDPIVRVPLFFRIPGHPVSRRDDVASLIDVMPTLAALVGLEVPSEVAGRNLFAEDAAEHTTDVWLTTGRHATVKRQGLVAGEIKYVHSEASDAAADAVEEVYRVGVQYDDERRLANAPLTELRERLAGMQSGAENVAERVDSLDAETRSQLEALGYSQPDAVAR